MQFFESDTLFAVVDREVRYRTIVLGSGDNTHSSTRFYYLLGFRLPKPGGTPELTAIQEVYRRHVVGNPVPHLQDEQLAPLVSHERGSLLLADNEEDVPNRPADAMAGQVRRWDGKWWFIVLAKGQPARVTDEAQGVTYTCPPTDALDPLWGCWDVNAGLVLFTESKSLPPYELNYLPPKAYLWYYRENRVETYTLDRVAVDKALRQFIRQQK